jgi:RNA polymerase sigma-70 factor, ECF subfamily
VDYARSQHRLRRGGGRQKVSLDKVLLVAPDRTDELLGIHELLSRLEELDARQGRIVELRYFAGLTTEETAEVLGVSPKTVQREWNMAKAWLYGELKERERDSGGMEAGQGII